MAVIDKFMRNSGTLLRDSVVSWLDDRVSIYAAALAYYAIFSLAPLVVVAVSVAGLFVGRSAAAQLLLLEIETFIGPDGAVIISDALNSLGNPSAGGLSAAIGAIVAIVGASLFFNHLKIAINSIWGIRTKRVKNAADALVVIRSHAVSLVMVLAVALLLVLSVILDTVLGAFRTALIQLVPDIGDLPGSVSIWLMPILGLLTFFLIFKLIPDAEVTVRDALAGALVTTLLFIIGVFVIGRVIIQSNLGSVYGAAQSLIVVLAWIYYSVQIILFGAEFTWHYAARHGTRIRPGRAAAPVGD